MTENNTVPQNETVTEEATGPQPSFWQNPFVQNILPFATSLLLHAGILLMGYLTYQAVKTVTNVIKEQIIIPDATIVEGAEVGGVPNPGLGTDPNMQSTATLEVQEQTTKTERSSISMGAIGGGDTSDGAIGIGSGTASLRPGGSGTGTGEAAASPFGVPGGGSGPRSPFMGVSGNAYRVVYICDASGTMLTRQYELKKKLRESIGVLKPVQSFNIFFLHDGDFESFDKGQLLPATPQNKQKVILENGWLDTTYVPEGSTNPIPVLRAAFSQDPQLIYLLTDGLDNPKDPNLANKVLAEIKKLNAAKKVHINTILIKSPGDIANLKDFQRTEYDRQMKQLTAILDQIATDNGGSFKEVTVD